MSNKFHISPDLFDDNAKNVYHPHSTRKLGRIVKDKHGNSTVQTTDDNQTSLFSDEDNEFSIFSGMARTKRQKKREPTPWEQRMKKYHNNLIIVIMFYLSYSVHDLFFLQLVLSRKF